MAKNQRQSVDDAPPGAPAWMLTFCDCMTLLLTFFVLLLSFSSFDPETQKQLNGAMKFSSGVTITRNRERVDDSLAPEVPPVQDLTDKGSEKKRSDDRNIVKNPKGIEPSATVGQYEETVLVLPVDEMFIGKSTILTEAGKEGLDKLASYLELSPRHVIIGESPAPGGPGDNLQRSWSILQFLMRTECLGPERFRISGRCPRPIHSNAEKATMQIVLLARDVTRTPEGV